MSVYIKDNNKLETIEGLAGVSGDLLGRVEISYNERLRSLDGLRGIVRILGGVDSAGLVDITNTPSQYL